MHLFRLSRDTQGESSILGFSAVLGKRTPFDVKTHRQILKLALSVVSAGCAIPAVIRKAGAPG
jgi:hypothetical protein